MDGAFLAQFVKAAIPGYLEEPGLEWFAGAQCRHGDIQLQKNLLSDIARQVIVAKAMADKIKEWCIVTVNERFKCLLVTRQGLLDKHAICDFRSRCFCTFS